MYMHSINVCWITVSTKGTLYIFVFSLQKLEKENTSKFRLAHPPAWEYLAFKYQTPSPPRISIIYTHENSIVFEYTEWHIDFVTESDF